jgi:hypothetical protein
MENKNATWRNLHHECRIRIEYILNKIFCNSLPDINVTNFEQKRSNTQVILQAE